MDRLCVFYEKLRRVVWQGIRGPSTYEIVYEEQAEETRTVQKDAEVVEWNSDSQIYWKILEADPEQIHFKSRLLTMLKR